MSPDDPGDGGISKEFIFVRMDVDGHSSPAAS